MAERYFDTGDKLIWTNLRDWPVPGFAPEVTVRHLAACHGCVRAPGAASAAALRRCANALATGTGARAGWAIPSTRTTIEKGEEVVQWATVGDIEKGDSDLGPGGTFQRAVGLCARRSRDEWEHRRTSPELRRRRKEEGAPDPRPWPAGQPNLYWPLRAVKQARGPQVPPTVKRVLPGDWGKTLRWYGEHAEVGWFNWMAGPPNKGYSRSHVYDLEFGAAQAQFDGCVLVRGLRDESWGGAVDEFRLKRVRTDEQWETEGEGANAKVAMTHEDQRYASPMKEEGQYDIRAFGNIPTRSPLDRPPQPSIRVCWRKRGGKTKPTPDGE